MHSLALLLFQGRATASSLALKWTDTRSDMKGMRWDEEQKDLYR